MNSMSVPAATASTFTKGRVIYVQVKGMNCAFLNVHQVVEIKQCIFDSVLSVHHVIAADDCHLNSNVACWKCQSGSGAGGKAVSWRRPGRPASSLKRGTENYDNVDCSDANGILAGATP